MSVETIGGQQVHLSGSVQLGEHPELAALLRRLGPLQRVQQPSQLIDIALGTP